MSEMDLNIDNYSITDLENFFKFKHGKYTESDVEKREYEIRDNCFHQVIYKRNLNGI